MQLRFPAKAAKRPAGFLFKTARCEHQYSVEARQAPEIRQLLTEKPSFQKRAFDVLGLRQFLCCMTERQHRCKNRANNIIQSIPLFVNTYYQIKKECFLRPRAAQSFACTDNLAYLASPYIYAPGERTNKKLIFHPSPSFKVFTGLLIFYK